MTQEELRDQLLSPVLQWTRLGRQSSELIVGSLEVISERSNGLLRGAMLRDPHDWNEMGLMTKEKLTVPIEAAVAMLSAIPSQVQQFVSESTAASSAVAGSALALASSRSPAEFSARQAAFCSALTGLAVNWYQLWGRAGAVVEEGLRPILRQVKSNAERLGDR